MKTMTLLALCAALTACGEKEPTTDDSSPVTPEDADGDGVAADEDCDDADASAFPGAEERCDGVDNDCDGQVDVGAVDAQTFYADSDGDGYGDSAAASAGCAAAGGQVSAGGDCNDARADVFPGASEVCDDVDNNCDGLIDEGQGTLWYADADRDGYGSDEGSVLSCQAPGEDWVAQGGDCDDSTSEASPGNTEEICDDGLDNDCDGAAGGCAWSGQIEVEDEAWARALGDRHGDHGGAAVTVLPDLRGDGQSWLLMSTPAEQADDPSVWLVDPSLLSGDALAEDVAEHSFRVRQSSLAYSLGSALDGGEDLTGDGVVDLVMTDRHSSAAGDYGGAVWVASSAQDARHRLDQDDAVWVFGDEDYGYLGQAARLSEDLTGDGAPDLAVSAASAENARSERSGIVYIVEGPFADQAESSSLTAQVHGEGNTGGFGDQLAAVDVNGDGADDLVISSPQSAVGSTSAAGMVMLFHGPISGRLVPGDADAVVRGDASGGLLGEGLAADDVDGDGQVDLFLGAPTRPGLRADCGEAALFLGPFSGVREYSAAEATYLGSEPSAFTGSSTLAPGDVDGDGAQDLVVGAALSGLNGEESGAAYVAYGPHAGQLTLGAGATFVAEAGGGLGYALAGGDLDGDGRADLALHQPGPSTASDGDGRAASVWLLSSGGL